MQQRIANDGDGRTSTAWPSRRPHPRAAHARLLRLVSASLPHVTHLLDAHAAEGALLGVSQDPVGRLALAAALLKPAVQAGAAQRLVRLARALEAELAAAGADCGAYGHACHKGGAATWARAPSHVLAHVHELLLLKAPPAGRHLGRGHGGHHGLSDSLRAAVSAGGAAG